MLSVCRSCSSISCCRLLTSVLRSACTAIDGARLVCFEVEKTAVTADFHLGNGVCDNEIFSITSKSSVPYTGAFILGKQCTAVPTRANLLETSETFQQVFKIDYDPAALKRNLHANIFANFLL